MSNGRMAIAGPGGGRSVRRRRGPTGVLGSLAVAGLILGVVAGPVAADDVSGGGSVDASVGVEGDCVVATAGTGGAAGSLQPHEDDGPSSGGLNGSGGGDTEVSLCRPDLAGVVADVAAVVAAVTDDLAEAAPGDPLGLLPGGLGLDPDWLGRLTRLLPGPIDTGGPGGSHADPTATVTPLPGGSATPSVVGGAADDARTAPEDRIPTGDEEPVAGIPAGTTELAPAGATLPRTGGGLGAPLLRLMTLAAAAPGLLRLAGRRRLAAAPDRF